MKRTLISFLFSVCCFLLLDTSNEAKASTKKVLLVTKAVVFQRIPSIPLVPFDSTLIEPFFKKYPKFNSFKIELVNLYRKHEYNYLWYNNRGINEFASLMYDKVNNLDQEGLRIRIPYQEELGDIFQDSEKTEKSNVEVELLLSSLYFFYADKVFKGLDIQKTTELGWYLPRKKQSYGNRLDSLLQDPDLINKPDKGLPEQYYQLKEALLDYRNIEKKGGWSAIEFPKKMKSLKPGDTAVVILKIRTRLFVTGDLKTDTKTNLFDAELLTGVLKYKVRNGFAPDSLLLPKHIKDMNIPVNERIKTLMINMERCRWISPNLTQNKRYIVVNIPSFTLFFSRRENPH